MLTACRKGAQSLCQWRTVCDRPTRGVPVVRPRVRESLSSRTRALASRTRARASRTARARESDGGCLPAPPTRPPAPSHSRPETSDSDFFPSDSDVITSDWSWIYSVCLFVCLSGNDTRPTGTSQSDVTRPTGTSQSDVGIPSRTSRRPTRTRRASHSDERRVPLGRGVGRVGRSTWPTRQAHWVAATTLGDPWRRWVRGYCPGPL